MVADRVVEMGEVVMPEVEDRGVGMRKKWRREMGGRHIMVVAVVGIKMCWCGSKEVEGMDGIAGRSPFAVCISLQIDLQPQPSYPNLRAHSSGTQSIYHYTFLPLVDQFHLFQHQVHRTAAN